MKTTDQPSSIQEGASTNQGVHTPGKEDTKQGGAKALPNVSLPKGGGTIRGIGEKFSANPVNGTGSMTVPIELSPGRAGFGPELSLSYDSGSGNGAFGIGWNLSIPVISRKTDKGLPQYDDARESDVYVLSGAEDLVPVHTANGKRFMDDKTSAGYIIHRYRPRIEGLFARIERWTDQVSGEIHWRSITRNNITTLYGKTANSRIADPNDSRQIFTWLICESYDDKGNAIVYEYATEDDRNIDKTEANERNRLRTANRYLKYIKYGNRLSRWLQPDLSQAQWMFQAVFDYGEGHNEEPELDSVLPETGQHYFVRASDLPARPWDCRPDPFSSHRAGFEVRTYRLCRRVLMFHHFPELGSQPCLVRSTEFQYSDFDYSQPVNIEAELAHTGSTRFGSFITSIIQSGFARDDTRVVLERNGVKYQTYLKKSLPPLEFGYSKAVIQEDIRELDRGSLENLPIGLDGTMYQWVDLEGEGLPGILTEQAEAWFYKENLGEGRFGPLKQVGLKPSLSDLGTGRQQFLDLAGNGKLDLVNLEGPTPGFYERNQEGSWDPFKEFRQLPNIPWGEPNLRFIDLNGDGHADVLITEHQVFSWYPALAEEGFGPARQWYKPLDEEHGPRLVLAEAAQSIYLADMCGDGLTDLVRIRNGEVCYWPNLGYGRFGAKVTMDNSPVFDNPDQFSHRQIRIADIDGTGTNDIIYLGRDAARIYLNQSGNRWSQPRLLRQFPSTDNLSSVMTADLLGNGTACLVWSSSLPGKIRPMCYIDLMGGQKPHLLIKWVNNLGAETNVSYASSTKSYLTDKEAGRPWISKIPFPVHVVEAIESYDRISGNLFVTRYAYHHGYFDGQEREFRGFGLVEQWDTADFAVMNSGEFPVGTNVAESSHVPPVLTRTWFHTGVYLGRERISNFFAGLLNEDSVLPAGLTLEEEREACRALKGSLLRQEVYALDGTEKEENPYTVMEQNFAIIRLQPKGDNRHAVFLAHSRELINYQYERNPADPRVSHTLTLEVDRFSNIIKSASVAYGRRKADPVLEIRDKAKQAETRIAYTENEFTNCIDGAHDYRAPLQWTSRTYELTNYTPTGAVGRFQISDFVQPDPSDRDGLERMPNFATEIDYAAKSSADTRQRRLIEDVRILYRKDNLEGPMQFGKIQSLALAYETYKLAFTPGLLDKAYGGRVSNEMLKAEGRYIHLEGDTNWWIPSGQVFYSPEPNDNPDKELVYAKAHFFLPCRYRDPFYTDSADTETIVSYDHYNLLVSEVCDVLGNRTTAGERSLDLREPLVRSGQDYRVLQPALIMDPNRNLSAVTFDALGMVVGMAVMGKPEDCPAQGDSLDNFSADLTDVEIVSHLEDPLGLKDKSVSPHNILGKATTRLVYDLFAYHRTKGDGKPQPSVVYALSRDTHAAELKPDQRTKILHSFSYSDGFGREIQRKVQAEPGSVPVRDSVTKRIVTINGEPLIAPQQVDPRWTGSGWTVFNNKGKPVRQYQPFFTDTHQFEFDTRIGASAVLFYDPVERVVATLHPNHTWEKIVFDAWKQETWDVNDTVTLNPQIDDDVKGFFVNRDGKPRLPTEEYLPTWYALRLDLAYAEEAAQRWPEPEIRKAERNAAERSAIHGATPTTMHLDSLGRSFCNIAHNKFQYSRTPLGEAPKEEFYYTRVTLDIEGNQREVIDAKERVVIQYAFDMLGNPVHQSSMDAGERWTLNDVAGKPIRTWDSRGHQFRVEYDELRRPLRFFVRGTDAAHSDPRTLNQDVLFEKMEYGESQADDVMMNLRTRLFKHYDGAGIVTSQEYDFKGNLLRSTRELAREYKNIINWEDVQPLGEMFSTNTTYDALNRPIELIAPHSDAPGSKVNTIRPTYNEANLLNAIEANLSEEEYNGVKKWTAFVTNIDYNAKGQRQRIEYGSGVNTTYEYDPMTFRLIHLSTRRQLSNSCTAELSDTERQLRSCPKPQPRCKGLQDLSYTYDPAGNITHIHDDAQQTIFFNNKCVEPSNDYTYDAIYQLIEATGREHLGQNAAGTPLPSQPASYNDKFNRGLQQLSDGKALGRYLERYGFDGVGNFTEMKHFGTDPQNPGWTRTYAYEESSQLEDNKQSNRLTSTSISAVKETYSIDGDGYDPHGNLFKMPQIQVMGWNFKDHLHVTQRQAVNVADSDGMLRQGERTYYVYDGTGQRVRKVTELPTGQVKEDRIYLDGFERYIRKDSSPLVRESLHIMAGKQRIALVETRTQGVEPEVPERLIRYQFGNHLGSASLELNDQAQIISYEEYTPYGSTSYQAIRKDIEVPQKRYRFTNKERDEESGLYYHGARYYAPWMGRWTAADPYGILDGLNLYRYVGNNPITFTDPNGTDKNPSACSSQTQPDSLSGSSGPENKRMSIDYNRLANPDGTFVDQSAEAATRFLESPDMIEQVHQDYLAGNERATAFWRRVNSDLYQIGAVIADRAFVRDLIGQGLTWEYLNKMGEGEGANSLRFSLMTGFQEEAQKIGLGLQIVNSVLMLLGAAAMARSALAAPRMRPHVSPTVNPVSAPVIRESAGASPRGPQFQSASAQTSRSLITSIRADIAESEAYKASLIQGEIGLQRPQGANVPGSDYITAASGAQGMEVIVTDVKMSTTGKFPTPAGPAVPANWMAEVQASTSPARLNLGNPALEQQIRAAVNAGRVRVRQVNVDYSPKGQGRMTGF